MNFKKSVSGWLIAGASLAAFATTATAASDGIAGKPAPTNNVYIVQMVDSPVSAYQGGIAGFAATKPRKGNKIDPNTPDVVRYKDYLASKQDAALARVGGGKKLYNYGYVFSGFAAELTAAQASMLSLDKSVLTITKDEVRHLQTASTPAFLGLSGENGFWKRFNATGENVIIGVVDSGAWPEHPSLSDRTGSSGNGSKDGKLGYQQIPGWNGKCEPGEAFTGSDCNQKLIGARYYNAGWGGNAGIDTLFPFEFNSPRDWDGHGTHTATTSGGNANVTVTGPAAVFKTISGIAPRARIAAYKVCWADQPNGGGCFGADSVAAIDQAVADGVDVINFSISGTSTNFRDPVEIAFLFAADAGVFVAASAGNSGPTASTVAHPSPWITTVAAGTHNRGGRGSVTLGNGVTYSGASVATALTSKPLINAAAAALAGSPATNASLCTGAADAGTAGLAPGPVVVLDPAKVAGRIVVCERGVTARVNKSLAVQQAGGGGMILVNTGAGSLNADFHTVPTVHLAATDRAAVQAYAATANASAAINAATIIDTAAAPFTASFSSRGPLRAGNGDLLKPDLIAPGQDILAAVSPVGYNGRLFDLLSGTSMSSPHVAGLAALFKELKPSWSPMAIKSALMTTGTDVLDNTADANRIFRQGAGHVHPNNAANPGLVFDSNFGDWLGFLCGTQLPTSFCTDAGVPVLDPSNLNTPSIAIGDLPGVQTVTRRVTNVSGNPASYTASFTGQAGIAVAMNPSTLNVPVGQTREFALTITNTGAALGSYVGGQLKLADGAGQVVRVPVVVRPVALAAPTQVGSGAYNVTFGYTGAFTATARGLIPSTVVSGTVTQDPDQTFDPAVTTGTIALPFTVPAGTTYLRLSLFDGDVASGSDIDLYVYRGNTPVGTSGAGGSDEEVSLVNPVEGAYTAYIHGWGLPSGASPFKLHVWALGSADAGNMTVTAPASATLGQTGTITVTPSASLPSGAKYLGSVAYGGNAGLPGPTIVRIDK